MMSLLRRALILLAVSAAGIALLAPLAARSAAPTPIDVPAGLLPPTDLPAVVADRGSLTARQGMLLSEAPATGPELVAEPALPLPASAPMQATLRVVATPPPTPVPPAPAPARVASAPRRITSGDGSVWDRLAQCESGGNWSINTGNGYYGGLQFSYSTWHGYRGGQFAEYPHQASRAEQITVAERLRAARGYAPWPACRLKLGLP